MISESLSSLRWGERAQAHKGHQRELVETPRMEGSHEGRQQGYWVPKGSDCDIPHRLGIGMGMYLYVYSHHF
jgi:hypothetical protein